MLTFKEFIKLPYEEQKERYKELSSHDKFRARTSAPLWPVLMEGEAKELTEEEKQIVARRKRLIREQIEEHEKKHNK